MWKKHSGRRTRPVRGHTGAGSRSTTLRPAHPTGDRSVKDKPVLTEPTQKQLRTYSAIIIILINY